MSLKEFLKLEFRKILITLIFILLSYFYIYSPATTDAIEQYRGLPLSYLKYFKGTGPITSGMSLPQPTIEFIYLNLIVDLVLWYIVSCIIILAYHEVKKR